MFLSAVTPSCAFIFHFTVAEAAREPGAWIAEKHVVGASLRSRAAAGTNAQGRQGVEHCHGADRTQRPWVFFSFYNRHSTTTVNFLL